MKEISSASPPMLETPSPAILDLIERLLSAPEPSRGLDIRIALAIDWRPGGEIWNGRTLREAFEQFPTDIRGILQCWPVPQYTGSVDAALTLLPDWASYELTRSAAGEPAFTRCRLWDWRRSPLALDPHNEWKSEDGNRPLPINICIAALKARTTSAGSPDVPA